MAIYGTGYRGLDYRQNSMAARLLPIVWGEYRALFRRRMGVVLFFVCLGPALFNLATVLLQMGVLQIGGATERLQQLRSINPRMDGTRIEFFLSLLSEPPSFLAFLVLTAVVSCRSIAKDRETRALEIYWTRCVEPRGYFLAKALGCFLLLGTVTVAAPLVTWVLGCLLAPDWTYLQATLGFVPRVLAALAIFTAILTGIAVMFSAVAGTANLASILWFSLIVGAAAVGRVLARVFPGEWWFKVINPWDAGKRVAEWICGYTPVENYPVVDAWIALGVVIGGLGILVVRRTRRFEGIG